MDYRNLHYKYGMTKPVPHEALVPRYGSYQEEEDVDYYMGQMRRVLTTGPSYGLAPEPALIFHNVYVGNTSQADNIRLMQRLGITHVLNCAGIPLLRPQRELRLTPEWGVVEYEEIPAEDNNSYDMTHHFLLTNHFLDHASTRGRVLIYCPDVNRSACIAIAYLLHRGMSLLKAAKTVKDRRRVGMYNQGFMKQLILHARDHSMLTCEREHLATRPLPSHPCVRHRPRWQVTLKGL